MKLVCGSALYLLRSLGDRGVGHSRPQFVPLRTGEPEGQTACVVVCSGLVVRGVTLDRTPRDPFRPVVRQPWSAMKIFTTTPTACRKRVVMGPSLLRKNW